MKYKPNPIAWITEESKWRLFKGGNCRGSVPVHVKESSVASMPLYSENQLKNAYSAGLKDAINKNALRG